MNTVSSLIIEVRNELIKISSGRFQKFDWQGMVSKLNQALSLIEDEEPAGMKDETVQMQNYSDPEPDRGMSHEIFNTAKPKE